MELLPVGNRLVVKEIKEKQDTSSIVMPTGNDSKITKAEVVETVQSGTSDISVGDTVFFETDKAEEIEGSLVIDYADIKAKAK